MGRHQENGQLCTKSTQWKLYYARKKGVKEGGVYGDGASEKEHLEEPKEMRKREGRSKRNPKSS